MRDLKINPSKHAIFLTADFQDMEEDPIKPDYIANISGNLSEDVNFTTAMTEAEARAVGKWFTQLADELKRKNK